MIKCSLTIRKPGSNPIQTPCGLLCCFCKKFHVPEYTSCVLAFQRDLLIVVLCCANRDYWSGWLGYGKCMSVDVLGENGMSIASCGWLWMYGNGELHHRFCSAVTGMTTCWGFWRMCNLGVFFSCLWHPDAHVDGGSSFFQLAWETYGNDYGTDRSWERMRIVVLGWLSASQYQEDDDDK